MTATPIDCEARLAARTVVVDVPKGIEYRDWVGSRFEGEIVERLLALDNVMSVEGVCCFAVTFRDDDRSDEELIFETVWTVQSPLMELMDQADELKCDRP